MKKAFTILLLFAVSLQIFGKLIVWLDYHYNQNYIVENYCINKALPKKHCKGKCYLKKQLEKADDRSSTNNAGQRIEIKDFIGFCFESSVFKINPSITTSDSSFVFSNEYAFQIVRSIFHPPKV